MIQKKVVGFVFVSLIFASLVVGFVSAQTESIIKPTSDIVTKFTNTASDILRPWEEGKDINIIVVKYLILVLVWMVVWSVSKHIPGLNSLFKKNDFGFSFLGAIFSFVVAFLALAYITPGEIVLIMSSYAGLGFTIGALLPTLIIMAWTVDIATSNAINGNVKSKVSSYLLVSAIWLCFGVVTLYKLSRVVIVGEISSNYFIYGSIIIVLLAGIMGFGGVRVLNKKMAKYITQEQFSDYEKKSDARVRVLEVAKKEVSGETS